MNIESTIDFGEQDPDTNETLNSIIEGLRRLTTYNTINLINTHLLTFERRLTTYNTINRINAHLLTFDNIVWALVDEAEEAGGWQ